VLLKKKLRLLALLKRRPSERRRKRRRPRLRAVGCGRLVFGARPKRRSPPKNRKLAKREKRKTKKRANFSRRRRETDLQPRLELELWDSKD
jgi:hypothetical protein